MIDSKLPDPSGAQALCVCVLLQALILTVLPSFILTALHPWARCAAPQHGIGTYFSPTRPNFNIQKKRF